MSMKNFKSLFGDKGAAASLCKNDFYDGGKSYTYKIKTKTPDGVSFEGNAGNAKKAKDSNVNLNFKDSDMEVKNKLDKDAVFTVDATMFKVADGVDVGLKFVTPSCTDESSALFANITPTVNYACPDLSASCNMEVGFCKDKAMVPAGGVPKINAEVCAKVMDDITAGFLFKDFVYAEKGYSAELDLALSHKCGGMEIQGHFLSKLANNPCPAPTALTASVHQKVGATAMCAEFKLETAADKPATVGINMCTSYAATPKGELKTKLSVGNSTTPVLDFAWVQKFEGKTLSLSHNYDGKDSSNFGIGCTIEV